MRILMLVPFPAVQGSMSTILPLLVDALRGSGCIVKTEPWGRHRNEQSVVTRALERPRDILRVRRRLHHGDVDVLLVQTSHEWPSLLRDLPLLALVRRRVPAVVVQFHGGRPDRLGKRGAMLFSLATRMLLRLANGVLVLSAEEVEAFTRFWPEGRFYRVVNPFVPSTDEAGSVTGVDDDRPTLLFAGRVIEEKGVFDLLDALAIVRVRLDCRLVIAGDGPDLGRVAARVEELRLGDAVQLPGRLDHESLGRAYRSADVFAFPTYWAEGFPTVLAEAMSAGLPIVTTRIRGSADLLEEGVNVRFVPPRDPSTLARNLEQVLREPALRERMGAANRRRVADFAPEAVVGAYIDALTEILRSQDPHRRESR